MSSLEEVNEKEQSVLAAEAEKSRNKPWPSAKAGWYTVFVLSLTLLVNFLDRGILTLLVPQIKADLQLSDTQMGIIMGFAFVFFYMMAGLPIARYADKGNRRNLIAVGLALWGGATALCGLAKGFGSLFLFRIGVGVGEACTGPATYSSLGDYFPPNKLPRAISVLNLGNLIGSGLAMLIGGSIIGLLSTLPPVTLPFYGELKTWQLSLILVGIPGLFVALLMLTVKEPERRVTGDAPSLKQVFAFLSEQRWLYGPLILGIALNTIAYVGNSSWSVVFFVRTYGWSVEQIALYMGLLMLVVMPIGTLVGSFLSERMTKAGYIDANMRLVLIVLAISIPLNVAFPLMPTGEMAIALSGMTMFLGAVIIGPQNAAIQIVTPNRMRGQITAAVLFGFNVIGYGLGPVILALVTDYVFQDEMQIRYALSSTYVVIGPLALFVLWFSLKPYRKAMELIKSEESGK